MPRNCDTCGHCVEANVPGQIMKVKFCTRNPPVMVGSQQGLMSLQPGIPPTNVCGEWSANPAESKVIGTFS